jgi:hypothetical protein
MMKNRYMTTAGLLSSSAHMRRTFDARWGITSFCGQVMETVILVDAVMGMEAVTAGSPAPVSGDGDPVPGSDRRCGCGDCQKKGDEEN